MSALTLDATSVKLSWQPPFIEDQNGVITLYTVNVTSVTAGYMMTLSTSDTELTVTELDPFTLYNFTVAAATSIGSGPFSDPVQAMTTEGSECP